MKLFRNILLIAGFVLVAQSCGTIIQGTTQQIGISSTPSNAAVTINGRDIGSTPLMVDLKRKDSHIVRISLAGYENYETTLTRKVSGWVWGNIVFGGIIGLVVDASTGGMYKLTPEQIEAQMRSNQARVTDGENTLYIAITLHADPQWEQVGSLTPVQ